MAGILVASDESAQFEEIAGIVEKHYRPSGTTRKPDWLATEDGLSDMICQIRSRSQPYELVIFSTHQWNRLGHNTMVAIHANSPDTRIMHLDAALPLEEQLVYQLAAYAEGV
jgi:hypothetical protein